jgi:hypothetical protein
MGTVSVSLPSDGETIEAADYNTPINTIVNEINGNISNANISASAAISGSKLASGGVGTTQIADDAITDAKRPRLKQCVVQRSGSQTITTGTPTKIQWNAEVVDVDNWHDNVTDNTRITVPETGLYIIQAQTTWTGMIGEYCYNEIYIDDTQLSPIIRQGLALASYDAAFANYVQVNSYPIIISANSYVEIFTYHDSGTDESINSNSWASVTKLSD